MDTSHGINGELSPIANTLNQAAARLGVSRSTVYRMIQAGELGYIHLRGRRLIPESELQRYVASQPLRHAS